VKFSPVDRCIASASGDKTIKIWSVTDGNCLKTLEGHTQSVLKIDFMSVGMQMVSVGGEGVMKLWTIKNDECVGTFEGHENKVRSLFNSVIHCFFVLLIFVFIAIPNQIIKKQVWALSVHGDGERVVSGGADSLLIEWNDSTIAMRHERIQKDQVRYLWSHY
jgi:U3 small nucleolar RNA-associated protein 13